MCVCVCVCVCVIFNAISTMPLDYYGSLNVFSWFYSVCIISCALVLDVLVTSVLKLVPCHGELYSNYVG